MYKLTARFEDETTLYTVEGHAEKIAEFYKRMESDNLPCTFELTYNSKPIYEWEVCDGKLVLYDDITNCKHVFVIRAFYSEGFTAYSYPVKTSNPDYIYAITNGHTFIDTYLKCDLKTTDFIAPTFERALNFYNTVRLP